MRKILIGVAATLMVGQTAKAQNSILENPDLLSACVQESSTAYRFLPREAVLTKLFEGLETFQAPNPFVRAKAINRDELAKYLAKNDPDANFVTDNELTAKEVSNIGIWRQRLTRLFDELDEPVDGRNYLMELKSFDSSINSREDQVMALLVGNYGPNGLVFVCDEQEETAVDVEGDDGEASGGWSWDTRIAKSELDVSKSTTATWEAALFSWAGDREAKTDTLAAAVTWSPATYIVSIDDDARLGRSDWRVGSAFFPYTRYNKLNVAGEGATDEARAKEINSLAFGAVGAFQFANLETGAFIDTKLGAEYITDDEFDASAYRASLEIAPAALRRTRSYTIGRTARGNNNRLTLAGSLNAAFDYVYVDELGEAISLAKSNEYGRVGYDINASAALWFPEQEYYFRGFTSYALRDDQTNNGGDAQLFIAGIESRLDPEGGIGLGLSYERGESLIELKDKEAWLLSISVLTK